MHWIALKMLTGDKAKFFGIVMGLTFASLLIYQQGSIFWGLMLRTAGQVTDIRGADLWVMDNNVRYVDDVKPMIENNLYRVRGVEGVKWAVPLYKGNARAKLNSKQLTVGDPRAKRGDELKVIEQVILLGLDDFSMVGAPQKVVSGSLEALRKPDAVIVDFTRLRKLYPGEAWALEATNGKPVSQLKHEQVKLFEDPAVYGRIPTDDKGNVAFYDLFLGREFEMNDHRAVIVGICEATRTFQSNAVVYSTYSRAKNFVPMERKMLSYILAKADDDPNDKGIYNPATGQTDRKTIDPAVVAKAILDQTGLKARTSEQFKGDTIEYYLKYTGIPINFGITAFLGFLVGTAIAGQTFYNFTLENLRQFGALKAMGATNIKIVGMILLQAVVVGLLGYGIGCGLGAGFGVMSKGGELAFHTHEATLPIVGVAIVFICILSSVLCIRKVMVLEPAIVFRG